MKAGRTASALRGALRDLRPSPGHEPFTSRLAEGQPWVNSVSASRWGEGQTERKGLLRFVLENLEGYDVVAEATSTLELAQRLVIHRPDVVVLDDGIDASAVAW